MGYEFFLIEVLGVDRVWVLVVDVSDNVGEIYEVSRDILDKALDIRFRDESEASSFIREHGRKIRDRVYVFNEGV